jgi:nucleoside-diphosphate-sugar epimerase
MTIAIIGGGGFIGRRMTHALRGRGFRVVVIDRVAGDVWADITEQRAVVAAVPRDTRLVVHLAALLSSRCEAAPREAFEVNVGGLANVIAAASDLPARPGVLFASSIAVFSGRCAGDNTPVSPTSVYGTTKAIGELMTSDATRRGEVVGASVRFPTVVGRSGKSEAASGFASAVLARGAASCTVRAEVRPQTAIVVASIQSVVDNLCMLAECAYRGVPIPLRMNLPGLSVTAAELARASAEEWPHVMPVRWADERTVAESLVTSWPARWTAEAAEAMAMASDCDIKVLARRAREAVDAEQHKAGGGPPSQG